MKNVKTFRTMRDMSQYDLAQASGLAQSTISLIERGYHKPSAKELKRLAKALQVNYEYLIEPVRFIFLEDLEKEAAAGKQQRV